MDAHIALGQILSNLHNASNVTLASIYSRTQPTFNFKTSLTLPVCLIAKQHHPSMSITLTMEFVRVAVKIAKYVTRAKDAYNVIPQQMATI